MSQAAMAIGRNADEEHLQLISAALDGRTSTVKALLRHGVDVNARTHEGRTALMFAIINMHPATVKELLKLGADVNAQSVAGFTPLFLAVCSGDARIVQALLDKGADVRKTLTPGQNALAHAAEHGYNDIVELLERAMNRSNDVRSQTVPESGSPKGVPTLW